MVMVLAKRGWWVIAFGGMGRMLYRDGCENAAACSGVISTSAFVCMCVSVWAFIVSEMLVSVVLGGAMSVSPSFDPDIDPDPPGNGTDAGVEAEAEAETDTDTAGPKEITETVSNPVKEGKSSATPPDKPTTSASSQTATWRIWRRLKPRKGSNIPLGAGAGIGTGTGALLSSSLLLTLPLASSTSSASALSLASVFSSGASGTSGIGL